MVMHSVWMTENLLEMRLKASQVAIAVPLACNSPKAEPCPHLACSAALYCGCLGQTWIEDGQRSSAKEIAKQVLEQRGKKAPAPKT
jgi:hypothetical protein